MTPTTLVTRAALKHAMLEAQNALEPELGQEVIDEMALPSYLKGNALSRLVFWRKHQIILKAAALRPHTAVLDYGCGSGVLLPHLCAEGRKVTAVDLHLGVAQYVSRSLALPGVSFYLESDWLAEVPADSLEAIIAANVLEHVEDRRRLLAEFVRRLKPGGRLVVSGPTENTLYRLGRRIVGFTGHYHVTNIYDNVHEVVDTGFRCVYRRRWPIPGPGCLYVFAAFERAH